MMFVREVNAICDALRDDALAATKKVKLATEADREALCQVMDIKLRTLQSVRLEAMHRSLVRGEKFDWWFYRLTPWFILASGIVGLLTGIS